MKDAAKLFGKWSNPYKGTIYAKYDNPAEDKAATTQLAEVSSPASKLRQLAAESLKKQREARASCKGNAGCEAVLQQVYNDASRIVQEILWNTMTDCPTPQVLSLFNAPVVPTAAAAAA